MVDKVYKDSDGKLYSFNEVLDYFYSLTTVTTIAITMIYSPSDKNIVIKYLTTSTEFVEIN